MPFDTETPETPDLQTARLTPEVQNAMRSLGVAEAELVTVKGAMALIQAAMQVLGVKQ